MTVAKFYEANAGTGKTRRLTDYIVERVQQSLPLKKVCAVTFTEKAATEMVDRLRQTIASLVQKGDLRPGILEELNDCFIGTIHGFCHQILKRYGEKIHIPPLFEIDKGPLFEEFFQAKWDAFLSNVLEDRTPAQEKLVRSLGIEVLELIAGTLAGRRYNFSRPPDVASSWLISLLRDAGLWGYNTDHRWPGVAWKALAAPKENSDLLLLLTDSAAKLDTRWKNAIRDALHCRTEEIYEAIEALQRDFVDKLLKEYRSLGYMRYDDLIIDTRNLLRNHLGIRRQLKTRYELLLVDEMQDTDPVQYEIFLYLAEKDGSEESFTLQELIAGKKKLHLQPGKLFVVGDPKQSIYGFRRADLNAYGRIKEVLHSQAVEVEGLLENHRSCRNLVAYTNTMAKALFPEAKPQDSIPMHDDFCVGKSIQDCVHLIRIDCKESDAVHLRVLAEANWLAENIKVLETQEGWSCGDVGILLRKLTNAHLYIDALSTRGIPVVVEGEKFFFQSQEVIDFLNLLKYIVDEMDAPALAGMLRSPLFGLNDFELASFFHHYSNTFDELAALTNALSEKPDDLRKALVGLVNTIQEIRRDLLRLTPGKLIAEVVSKLPVLTVASISYGAYRNHLAPLNILKIHKEALQADADPNMTAYRFVKTFESYSKEGKESPQEAVADEGTQAVRVMSIHKSKGLDFPVVFVPLTDYGFGGRREDVEVIHDWETDQAGIRIKNYAEANYLNLKYQIPEGGRPCPPDGQLSKVEEEERRVLYVAATRAKQQLYFCYTPNPNRSDPGIGDDIFQFLQELDHHVQVNTEQSAPWLSRAESTEPLRQVDMIPVLKEWELVEAARERYSALQIRSVTLQARMQVEVEEPPSRLPSSGFHALLVGLICHSALEKMDYLNPGSVPQLIDSVKWKFSNRYTSHDLRRAAKEAVAILESFLRSDVAQWLASVEILGREVPVCTFDVLQNRILTGTVDLFVRDASNHYVIDYKSNLLIEETELEVYRTQMRLYAKALEDIVGTPVSARLCLVRPGKLVELNES